MNTKKILWFQIAGAIFTIIVGSLLHFVFEWSGGNEIVGILGSVNESTWEHLKLLAFPVILFGLIEYFAYGKDLENFIPVKFLSILLGMATIVVTFYTYTGILGDHYLVLDILTFVLGVIVTYTFAYRNLIAGERFTSSAARIIGVVGIIVLIALFAVFTFHPPEIELFFDGTKGIYGIPKP